VDKLTYSVDHESFHEEDPEQLAADYMEAEDLDECTVYQGVPYLPASQDEIDELEDGYTHLIKDAKPYKSYVWDDKSNWVKERGEEG